MHAFVEIHIPGKAAERHVLTSERTTLGTAPGATIRLPALPGLEAAQLELQVGAKDVRVQVPPGTFGHFLFEGTKQRRAHIPFGAEAFVGNVRLSFLRASNRKGIHPALLLMAPMVLVLTGLGTYGVAGPFDVAASDPPAPTLYDALEQVSCPETDRPALAKRAQDQELRARAKFERSAFVESDGLEAIVLLQRAYVCWQQTGQLENAARVQGELRHYQERLDEYYAGLRLQLRLALDQNRPRDALAATRELQCLLAHRTAPAYRQWLTRLEQTLETRVAKLGS
jgi:hypothetical protein